MNKQLYITIPKPCHEDWSKMTPNQQGAFCQACQKTVIDFSLRTENEIYEIISKADGNVCGRFTTMQLARPIRKTELNNGYMNWRAVAASVAMLFSFSKVWAGTDSENKPSLTLQKATVMQDTTCTLNETKDTLTQKSDGIICLRGKVLDADNMEPIVFAILQLGNSGVAVITDFDGSFMLEIEGRDVGTLGDSLIVSCVGYNSRTISWHTCTGNDFIITLQQQALIEFRAYNVGYLVPVFTKPPVQHTEKADLRTMLNAARDRAAFREKKRGEE